MRTTPTPVIIATLSFGTFWVLLVVGIAVFGRNSSINDFREKMLRQWKPALAITLLFILCMALGGRGVLNPYAIGLFCQALVGFAIARSIPGFQAIPVAVAFGSKERRLQAVGRSFLFAVLAVALAFLAGTIGIGICRQLFHETAAPQAALSSMPQNKTQLLWLFLAGAGLAEETPYRLVAVSLIWWWSGRRGLAIFVSSVIFGAYHLTPLSGMYLTFWHYPISQFVSSTLVGLVWGWAYTRAGYEAVVAGHTLSDWLPALIFLK